VIRRRFIHWLLGSSAAALMAAVFYPVVRFLSPPEVAEATTNQVEAGPTNDPELLERGFKILRFGAEPVLLVRVSETDFRAFEGVCTHLDCIVEYQPDQQRIWCACHNGEYDLRGNQVAGPPPRPLQGFEVDLVDQGPGRPALIVVSRA